MGLLKGALLAPLAPVRGVVWIAQCLEREARTRSEGPESAKAQLAELYHAFDRGEVDARVFDAEEERLLRQLLPPGHGTNLDGGPLAVPTDNDGKWER